MQSRVIMPSNGIVVTRYPLPVRVGVALVCLTFAAAIARGPISVWIIAVGVAAFCLATAILAYKAEIGRTEVRIRHAPFFTKRTPIQDVTHLVEERTLTLVTPTSKIPLWGLSSAAREEVFRLLPRHLEVQRLRPSQRDRRIDSTATVRKHVRWTITAGPAFLASVALVVPFFKGNALHEYWNSAGKYVLLLCLLLFIALVFEAGFTWVLWSNKRDVDRIENRDTNKQH
jgi:hypothetical protein